MPIKQPLEAVADEELLRSLSDLLNHSRWREADLVAHIGEADRRRLFAREAFPSMFAYCTRGLHLSEHEAYLRITVARAARKHPQLLGMLGDGRLHLAAIAKLAPRLTPGNRDAVLERAVHRSKLEIEELVAELAPRPDAPAVVRRLPVRAADELQLGPDRVPERDLALDAQTVPVSAGDLGPSQQESPKPAIQPLAPDRYKVQFTAGPLLRDKLERLRGLMRSEVPDGDLATIIEKAVTEKLERLEARRHGATKAPRKDLRTSDISSSSRYIPAAVRRAVQKRDGSRCRYVDAQGRRCSERHLLEYHHRHPYALGGDHSPRNVCLMCRTHNRLMAEQDYGREAMARHGGAGRGGPPPAGVSPAAPPP